MLETFYPDHEAESVYGLDYEGFHEKGFRGVIFDIDNTLVPHGAPADKAAVELFARLHEIGFETLLLSKPGKAGYRKAMERMGTLPETTLFVGDQLFTDVWGAKKAGIMTYLVKPIHPKEEIQIVLKRRLEWIVLFFYHRKAVKKEKTL